MSSPSSSKNKSKNKEFIIKSNSRNQNQCHWCQKTPQDLGSDKPFQTCSRCKEVIYCSTECQRLNWPLHKLPCSKSKERNAILAQDPARAASAAKFAKWFERPPKLDVLRQAAMQALDIINHPENVDRKAFHIRMKLHPNYKNRDQEDRYILERGLMFPKETMLDPLPADKRDHLIEYIKVQNDFVKGRGEIGVVPVMMEEVEVGADGEAKPRNSSWLPLALPFTLEEAKVIMRLAKWGDVFWEARLRDTLAVPEAQWKDFVPNPKKDRAHCVLPDHLLKNNPMEYFVNRAVEMNLNDPNSR
ncbi:hypothetical protein F5146DRAFT_554075 [Armillaria mellea]|nr:hypothetical protein F5146DRAFT_554075 [Armillaria mellea]